MWSAHLRALCVFSKLISSKLFYDQYALFRSSRVCGVFIMCLFFGSSGGMTPFGSSMISIGTNTACLLYRFSLSESMSSGLAMNAETIHFPRQIGFTRTATGQFSTCFVGDQCGGSRNTSGHLPNSSQCVFDHPWFRLCSATILAKYVSSFSVTRIISNIFSSRWPMPRCLNGVRRGISDAYPGLSEVG